MTLRPSPPSDVLRWLSFNRNKRQPPGCLLWLQAAGLPAAWLPGSAGAERAWRQASPGAKQAFDALHDKFLDEAPAR